MSRTRLRHLLILPLLLLGMSLTGCEELDDLTLPTMTEPDPVPTADQSSDYYTVIGPAVRLYGDAGPTVNTCDLDELDRATCAYVELTSRDKSDSEGDLPDPAGWPEDNREVDIPALEGVEGSKPYHGWMMNRSHLVADSLGGPEVAENLVTGTRTQNVGSHQVDGQYAGGMAYTEKLARDYIDSGKAASCPLYYATTPEYSGDELVPRTVIVDIVSCDQSIDQRVEVSNTAAGWEIDYTDGSFAEVR